MSMISKCLGKSQKRAIIIGLSITLILILTSVSLALQGAMFKRGYVGAKGFVKKDNSYVMVEYDDDNKLISGSERILADDMIGSIALSADEYTYQANLRKIPIHLLSTTKSVLVDGQTFELKAESPHRFGYLTAYYSKDPDVLPERDDRSLDSLNSYVYGNTAWAPLENVKIILPAEEPTSTDEKGFFLMGYSYPPECMPASIETHLFAELRFTNFDPKIGPFGYYLLSRPTLLHLGGDLFLCDPWHVAFVANLMSFSPDLLWYNNFSVDVAVLTGGAYLVNDVSPDQIDPDDWGSVKLDEKTVYKCERPIFQAKDSYNFDFDANKTTDKADIEDGQVNITVEKGPDNQEVSFHRQDDVKPDWFHRGLLKSISLDDLQDTDIYVYRMTDNTLLTSRKGLKPEESNPFHGGGGFEGDQNAKLHFKMLIRSDPTKINTDKFLPEKVNLGDRLKIFLINRATGYMGSAETTVTKNGSDIDITPKFFIAMHPPNLKIMVKRKKGKGMFPTGLAPLDDNESDDQPPWIGYEGTGLIQDEMIVIRTDWTDWDGSPLPTDLPGFTGRLAKIVGDKMLVTDIPDANYVGQFPIKPGRQTQIVKTPMGENVNKAYYYIQVNGHNSDDVADFSSIDFDTLGGEDAGKILEYRPKHFVPVLVPVYNEQRTWDVKTADPDAKQPIYEWLYRPEMMFTLMDLDVELVHPDEWGNLIYLSQDDPDFYLSLFEPGTNFIVSMLSPFYADMGDPDEDIPPNPGDLPQIGADREMIFGQGNQELVFNLDQQTPMWNLSPETYNLYEPGDLIILSLYQNADDPNTLWEYGFKSDIQRGRDIELQQQYRLSAAEDDPLRIIESYEFIQFQLTQTARVKVTLLDPADNEKAVIIDNHILSRGVHNFVVDYQMAKSAGFDPFDNPDFKIRIQAKVPNQPNVATIWHKGKLTFKLYRSHMLNQIMAHDVLIQNGSLNLSRQDFELKGLGPQLSFGRNYCNLSVQDKGEKPMGKGWQHSMDKTLRPMVPNHYEPGGYPSWLASLRDRFFNTDEIPDDAFEWSVVSTNGVTFTKLSGTWKPDLGYHSRLTEDGDNFIFTAKDGTSYVYDKPKIEIASDSIIEADEKRLLVPAGTPPAFIDSQPVQEISDRNGHKLTFSYDGKKRVTSIKDAVNREMTFQYGQVENLAYEERLLKVEVSVPNPIELDFVYDEQGCLKKVIRGDRTESYEYAYDQGVTTGDARYNLVKTTDSNDHSFRYAYYAPNTIDLPEFRKITNYKSEHIVSTVFYPDNNDAEFTYPEDFKREVKDLRNNVTTYTLNAYGNPMVIEEPMGKITQMTWDTGPDNVMTEKYEPNGEETLGKWTYGYDTNGNIIQETDPYGHTISTTWNEFSQPLTRIDRKGNSETWIYDARGNLISYANGDNKTYTYGINSLGQRESMTTPLLKTTNYTYDENGNPDKIEEPEGSITDFDYDNRGRMVKKVDPNKNVTLYEYDNLDHLKTVTYPAIAELAPGSTNIEIFSYDAEGNLITETNRNNLTLTYSYTSRNQVETVTRNIGGLKKFGYDENGNLKSETDWKQVATKYDYNDLNRRIKTTNRLGIDRNMVYDLAGNLISEEDFNHQVTNYKYDKLNRLVEIEQPLLLPNQTERGKIKYTYYDEADPKTNLKTETDQENHTTTYEYNGRYLRIKRINANLDEHLWNYDDDGNLANEVDEELKTITYEYDNQNRLSDKHEPMGKNTHFAYDYNGNIITITDGRGKDWVTEYDAWNRVAAKIDPLGNRTETQYDGMGNVYIQREIGQFLIERKSIRDARGLVMDYSDGENNHTTYSYDFNGNVETVTYPNTSVTTTTYDAEDREISVTQADGTSDQRTKTVLHRDGNGNPTEVKDFRQKTIKTDYNALNLPWKVYDSESSTVFSEYTYYKTGKLYTVINRRSILFEDHDYDALNREIKISYPLGYTVEKDYDRVGNLTDTKDKRGIWTHTAYDDLYRPVNEYRSLNKGGTDIQIYKKEYDPANNLKYQIDAENIRTDYSYYDNNRLDVTTFMDGSTIKKDYYPNGIVKYVRDETNQYTNYTYDGENREKTVEFAGETTRKDYDAMGNLIRVTKPKLNQTYMEYDFLNRLKKVVEDETGLRLTTEYVYDENDNVLEQYLPNLPKNNHVHYEYDDLNRKTQQVIYNDTTSLITQFDEYDHEGNLLKLIDPKGQTIVHTYDDLNRQIQTDYPSSGINTFDITKITRGYDGNDNVTSVIETKTDPAGATFSDTTTNIYHTYFDWLTESTQRGQSISYEYYGNGNRKKVTTSSGTTDYTYDNRNRLENVTFDGKTTHYTYLADGRQHTIEYPNNMTTTYGYFDTKRIQQIVHRNTSTDTILSQFDYTYDHNGNRESQIETQSGISHTTTYHYDGLDRLTDYTFDNITTEYTFAGYNRQTETVTQNSVQVSFKVYTYNQANWLTQVDKTEGTNTSTITYTYDNNGNTILKSDSSLTNQDISFTYNARD